MTERFQHKKSLGQHFLNSDYVPKLMCDAGAVSPGDTVVEVGPGTGVLTKEILARGATVIALETDSRTLASLETTCADTIASGQLTLMHTDVRHLDLTTLPVKPHNYKVVANIPYYISGLLFRTFLDSDCQPNTLVFLVQRELAARIAREPKSSLLSLSVQAFGTTTYISTIKRGHFTPPPQVDSAIIAVSNVSNEYFDEFDKSLFFHVIKAGFASKRKQLAPNLKSLYPVEQTKAILVEIGQPATARAEDLTLSDWYQLLIKLGPTV